MKLDDFWEVIERSKSTLSDTEVDGNFERQAGHIKEHLLKQERSEIIDFSRHSHELSQSLYSWELWGAAYVIGGGCSDDSFSDFRSWIISLGKQTYDLAISSPDELGPISQAPSVEDNFFEEFSYIADEVYEELFEEEIDIEYEHLSEPKGARWDEEAVMGLYPKLAAIFA